MVWSSVVIPIVKTRAEAREKRKGKNQIKQMGPSLDLTPTSYVDGYLILLSKTCHGFWTGDDDIEIQSPTVLDYETKHV